MPVVSMSKKEFDRLEVLLAFGLAVCVSRMPASCSARETPNNVGGGGGLAAEA